MFQPNRIASLKKVSGRNLDGEETLGEPTALPMAIVNLATTSQKTAVRTDSSASRGNADELASPQAKILTKIETSVDDRVEIDGQAFRVMGTHPRYTVYGVFDHYEVILELVAE